MAQLPWGGGRWGQGRCVNRGGERKHWQNINSMQQITTEAQYWHVNHKKRFFFYFFKISAHGSNKQRLKAILGMTCSSSLMSTLLHSSLWQCILHHNHFSFLLSHSSLFQGQEFPQEAFISLQPPSSILPPPSVSRFLPILAHLYSLIKRTYDTLKSVLSVTLKLHKCVRLYSDENGVLFSSGRSALWNLQLCFPWQNREEGWAPLLQPLPPLVCPTCLRSPLYQRIQSVLPSTCPPSCLFMLQEFIVTIVWQFWE